MAAPETEVGPSASDAGAEGAARGMAAMRILVAMGVGAFSVLFFIKTQDAMILIFGLIAVAMLGLGWPPFGKIGAPSAPPAEAGPAPVAWGPGAWMRLGVQLAIGAFALLFFIKTQDAMILIFGVIAVALVQLAFRPR